MSGGSGSSNVIANRYQGVTDAGTGIWLDVTAADTDSAGYALMVSALNVAGSLGMASLNPKATNGVWYNPGEAFAYLSAGETATDSFTYTVSDGHGGIATATVTVTIIGVNQPPVARGEQVTTAASQPVAINVLAATTDVNRDDVLSVVGLNTTATRGSVTLGANGVATYAPGAAFAYLAVGTTATDSFGYTVTDNHGATSTSTVTVTVAGTWLRPVATAEAAATTAKQPVTIAVLASDSDPEPGQALSLTALNLAGTKGTAVLNANGTVTYTPGAAYVSLPVGATATDAFGYTVSDGHGVSSTGTVRVTVTGVDTPPTAKPDTATTTASRGVWLSATNNDIDLQGYTLAVIGLNTTGTKGIASLNRAATNGVYYSPGTAFAYLSQGETATDSFTYTVSDGHGGTATATDTVTIIGVNQPPVARGEQVTTTASQPVAINVLAATTDVNRDDVLSVVGLSTTATRGSVTLGANGVATYAPGAAFAYLAAGTTATDSFGYTVTDNHGATSTSTVTVTVAGTWLRPVATAEAAATTAKQPVTIAVLASDSDPEPGQALSLTALNLAGTKGTAVLNANGTVTYTPGAAYVSLPVGATATDAFGYTVSDGHGVSSTGTVRVTVTGVDTPPTAKPDTATTTASRGVWLSVTNNDIDLQGYTLAVIGLNTTGTKGIASLNRAATNGVYYSPGTAFAYLSQGETATDSFTYIVSDGHGGTATATDTVTITGVNQPPVAGSERAVTTATQPVQFNLLAADKDVNRDDVLSITGLNTTGTQGIVTLSPNGIASYAPGPAFQYLAAGTTATDSFSYTVSDNHGASAIASDSVTVTGTWAPPIATAESVTAAADGSVAINVLAGDSDPQPGQTLKVTALNLAGTDGVAVVNPNGTITYTPGRAYAGLAAGSASRDSFGYTISDGHGSTASSTVSVTVTAPGASASAPQALYVATDGNDNWSGKLAAPNASGTDGPLATLQAAQAKIQASATKTTYVEGGAYYETSTLTLGAPDSGESWLAMPGEAVVINGGQPITGWAQGGNGLWTAPAPTGALAAGNAGAELYLDGTRETLARYPDAAPANPIQGGWLTAADSVPGQSATNSFQFNPGDIPVLPSTASLYVVVYQQNGWQSASLPVASIDYTTNTIDLAGASGSAIGAGSRYFIYNASNLLSTAGEWYGDPATNVLTLDAPAGFDGNRATAGSLDNIISVNGASNVTIAGLTLQGSDSTGSAIRATAANGLTIAGNTIGNVGNGIVLAGAGSGVDIEGNQISNTNNNGVLIYAGTNNVTIKGNAIQNIGQLLTGNGIWFTGSSNDTITNNLIRNVAHDGIGGGSTVGTADASYNDAISYNQIVNANLASSDGGAIYLANRQLSATGDMISFNAVSATSAAGTANSPQTTFLPPSELVSFGIYLDDYSNGVTVHGNLLDGNLGGIDIHAGSNNAITDNIIADSAGPALFNQVANPLNLTTQPPSGNLFQGNLVSDSQPGPQLSVNLGDPTAASWSGNFYDAAGLSDTAFVSDTSGVYKVQSLADWQAAGYDAGALSGTPGFAPGGGYTLPPGSAAAAAGITSPPLSQIGLPGFIAGNPYDLAGR